MRIGNIIVALCILLFTEAQGEVLLRTTFEDYEGEPWENGWVREPEDSIYVRREAESQDYYQTQAHGRQSLYIYDPNSSTYSNVKHEFPDIKAGEEYMVEFYLWVPSEDQNGMYLYKPTIEGDSADIQLLLHGVNGQTLTLHVRDKNGIDTCSIDSLDVWHKIQIHKRTDSIDLYIDRDTIGTFISLSDTISPDTFLIGTVDTLQDGEGFWDDFIITTPPTLEHPRLFFDSSYIDTLQNRRGDYINPTSFGVSYRDLADSLI